MSAEQIGVRPANAPVLRVSAAFDNNGAEPFLSVPFVPPNRSSSSGLVCAPPLPILASNGLGQEYWYCGHTARDFSSTQCLQTKPVVGGITRPEITWESAATEQFLVLAASWHGAGHHAEDTQSVYQAALSQAHLAGFPVLLRSWNYLPKINACFGQLDGYQLFCQGREQAINAAQQHGLFQQKQHPAATAIGSPADNWQYLWLFMREESFQALENPRQVPAWEYPSVYSPSKPTFSRAVQMADSLLCSGTASVIGHETSHKNDVARQCEESLKNIQVLLHTAQQSDAWTQASALKDMSLSDGIFRVYARHEEDTARIAKVLQAHAVKKWVVFRGDICRSDLLVECEAAFTPPC